MQEEVLTFMGKEIFIDTSKLFFNEKINYKNFLEKRLKIVVYNDSAACSMCQMRLPEWKMEMRELRKYKDHIDIMFIANTKDIENVQLNFIKLKNIVLYDTLGVFKKQNSLSSNALFHTFLLDHDNKVLIVGNPLSHKKIWEYYKTMIENTLQL